MEGCNSQTGAWCKSCVAAPLLLLLLNNVHVSKLCGLLEGK